MGKAKSKISFYVPAGEFAAGDAALEINGQLGQVSKIIAEMDPPLKCARSIAGGQCRAELSATIDKDHPTIVNIKAKCDRSGTDCQDTCDGVQRFLISDWFGSLSISEPGAFID